MVAPFVKQSWAVAGVLVNMIGQGMVLSFPSSLMPALRDPASPIRPDLQTASWIASSIGLAGIPGLLISSFLMERFGRRMAHILVILPGILGWIVLYFAADVPALMIGRILTGFSAGATVTLGAVVIGEYTNPEHRGMFLNLKTASVSLGSMLVHIFGNYFTWRTVALFAVIPLTMALLIIYTWPESPAWLASKKHFKKCELAFYWLRGKSERSNKELDELIKAQMDQSVSHMTTQEKTVHFFKKFTRKDFLKPMFIVFLGGILLEVCGRHFFPAYALDIIEEVTGSKSQSFYYTLAIDIIITASATFSSVLVKLMNRRTLLFSTGSAALIMLLGAITYLFLASRDVVSKEYTWIPLSLFVMYFIFTNFGCTPIPLSLFGEVWPLAHRAVGSAVGGILLSSCLYVGLLVTPLLLYYVKVYGTFAVFGASMGIVLLILYFILPETKDRTLQEIEDYFNDGRFRDDKDYDAVNNVAEEEIKMLGNKPVDVVLKLT